jgi:type I site-specific restriction endonuclease
MSAPPNQNPEQIARDIIDAQLRASGWAVQGKDEINFNECQGQAIREYSTDTGPADYVLFVDKKPVGIIEAKKDSHAQNITTVEEQTGEYASAKLKWVQNTGEPLPFLYEATGVITRFTDQRDPNTRSHRTPNSSPASKPNGPLKKPPPKPPKRPRRRRQRKRPPANALKSHDRDLRHPIPSRTRSASGVRRFRVQACPRAG